MGDSEPRPVADNVRTDVRKAGALHDATCCTPQWKLPVHTHKRAVQAWYRDGGRTLHGSLTSAVLMKGYAAEWYPPSRPRDGVRHGVHHHYYTMDMIYWRHYAVVMSAYSTPPPENTQTEKGSSCS